MIHDMIPVLQGPPVVGYRREWCLLFPEGVPEVTGLQLYSLQVTYLQSQNPSGLFDFHSKTESPFSDHSPASVGLSMWSPSHGMLFLIRSPVLSLLQNLYSFPKTQLVCQPP